ncbi:MAG: DUF2608 domain-containing protein [Burkholderiales bacterium]
MPLLNTSSCPTITIYTYKEVYNRLNHVNPHTLILFDIDDTITSSPDILARANYFPWWFRICLLLRFPQFMHMDIWEKIFSYMWQQAPRTLIEPQIPEIIAALQCQGSSVLGFTRIKTGPYGAIEDFPAWRVQLLQQMGITFTQTYGDHCFKHLKPYRHTYPMLYQGLLCTNQQDKGPVFAALLNYLPFMPKHIIYFDDHYASLQQLGKICQKQHLPCTLYHYRAVELLPGKWSTKRALKQFEWLVKYQRWMNDEEVDRLLTQS